MADWLSSAVNSSHEKDFHFYANLIGKGIYGTNLSQKNIKELTALEKRRKNQCESSHLLSFFVDILHKQCPEAKFVLVYRSPEEWLKSVIKHQLWKTFKRNDPVTLRMHEHFFGNAESYWGPPLYHPEECELQRRGFYTISGYLRYWSKVNTYVLEHVPEDSLLILNTKMIGKVSLELNSFLQFDNLRIKDREVVSYKSPTDINYPLDIDKKYIDGQIDKYCSKINTILECKSI